VYNSNEAERYLKRSLMPIGKEVVNDIKKSGRSSSFILHDSLANIEIFFEAFPKMKWINLDRHPVDLIYSWYLRGWGHRFASDPLSFIPLIENGNQSVSAPWYTCEWIEEYSKMSEMDRVIKSIATLLETEESAYGRLAANRKKQILFISYENLVENTGETVGEMAEFLKVKISTRMNLILNREKCPSKISPGKRKEKLNDIKSLSGKDMFKLMMRCVSKYEKKG
jgi:hypothetical protein